MDELTQLTIVFSVVILVALPLCTYVGYRLGHFRGYVAARHLFVSHLTTDIAFWSPNGGRKRYSADKVEK